MSKEPIREALMGVGGEKNPGVTGVPDSAEATFLPFFAYYSSNVDFLTCAEESRLNREPSKKNSNQIGIAILL